MQNESHFEVILGQSNYNNSCGVAILWNKSSNLRILKIYNDIEGRLIYFDFCIGDNAFRLINIYAPVVARERKEFFKLLFPICDCNKLVILCGDFNMIESSFDKRGGNPDLGRDGVNIITEIKQQFKISDAHRICNAKRITF